MNDVLEIGQTLVCQSSYKLHFTLGLLSLQALLILFGAFLAFQTRKVSALLHLLSQLEAIMMIMMMMKRRTTTTVVVVMMIKVAVVGRS